MSSKTVEVLAESENTAPGALSWVEELRRVSVAVSKTSHKASLARNQLFYLLHWTPDRCHFGVTVHKGREPELASEWWSIDRALDSPPFVGDKDLAILRLLWAGRTHETGLRAFGLGPEYGNEALRRMARTGRLCPADDLSLLQLGGTRQGRVAWRLDANLKQQPYFKAEPAAALTIPLHPPWYVDLDEGVIGPLEVTQNPEIIERLFSLPPLTSDEVLRIGATLGGISDLELPSAGEAENLRCIEVMPVSALHLRTISIHGVRSWRDYESSYNGGVFDVAEPVFRYQDAEIKPGDSSEIVILPDGETVCVLRKAEREAALMASLFEAGFRKVPGYALHTFGSPPGNAFGLAGESNWQVFMQSGLERLRNAGWQIEFDEDFRHHALEIDAWEADLIDSGDGWFDLDMGIVVEGQRLPLAPLLASLFRCDPRWLEPALLQQIEDDEKIELKTPAGQRILAPAARLKPLAVTLIDLFDKFTGGPNLRISRFDAPRLSELNDTRRWQFRGQGDVMQLVEKLLRAQGIGEVEVPKGLGLQLRPYQKEGLAWLQFLREQNLSGILADDMGLGKTAQALAHLLVEKEAGRLDRPALIVLPTSLIFNWKNEAARFAPGLSVLSLHGAERKKHFEDISRHDVVLTTYPLLWRDAEELMRFQYHMLILDEAQTVKNARSQGANAVRRIEARHRLCLTGTPLENHLGELWSQFDFLLPGFLGSNIAFNHYWRSPIEKQGDDDRRNLLARRIRPFILRRKKEEVARELPPKNIIVRKVELAGSQRDLYETVRSAMDVMVREEVASKGLGRSQIVILDALLKLRQVCCDPRLVKAKSALRVKERAKLDLLMTMLPELVEEGRRILVFSQFTSMLSLIEHDLENAGLDYLVLTGDTTDRETPVRRFQNGEVPIFLVSLKAGGVGLNLTAADTVIHFDPWWNPAVENQATDRAHRLGQDKQVFAYKLIVAGSIEEKILALQERKADLVAGILSDESSISLKFGEEDIAALFAPLPV